MIDGALTPEAIRSQRERIGLTQVQLSKLVGVTAQAIRNYEWAARSPSPEVRERLRMALYGANAQLVKAIADAIEAGAERGADALEDAIAAGRDLEGLGVLEEMPPAVLPFTRDELEEWIAAGIGAHSNRAGA